MQQNEHIFVETSAKSGSNVVQAMVQLIRYFSSPKLLLMTSLIWHFQI